MFIQQNQQAFGNLFVAVSFDIVVAATNKSMYGKHSNHFVGSPSSRANVLTYSVHI